MNGDYNWTLLKIFVPFSLVSFGGGASILAGIQHQVVDVEQMISARDFLDLFALSRGAPGPGTMLVTLIGWKVGGWTGALVATLAIFVPSSILCFMVARIWNRHRGKPWHTALANGLEPVGTGLLMSGAIAILQLAKAGPVSLALCFSTAAILYMVPRLHPMLFLFVGGFTFIAFGLRFG